MAQQTKYIYIFDCDVCDTHFEWADIPKGGITNLQYSTKGAQVTNLEICSDCFKAVSDALIAREPKLASTVETR